MPTLKKVQEVKEIRRLIGQSQAMLLADYRGLTVAEVSALRNELRENSARLKVTKNRLLKLALKKEGCVDLSEHLTGPTAIAFGFEDPVALAKILVDFAKKHDVFSLKAGMLGEAALDRQGVESLSKMPGLPEVRSQLAGSMMQPLKEVATMMQANMRELATASEQMLSKMLYAFQDRQQQLES